MALHLLKYLAQAYLEQRAKTELLGSTVASYRGGRQSDKSAPLSREPADPQTGHDPAKFGRLGKIWRFRDEKTAEL